MNTSIRPERIAPGQAQATKKKLSLKNDRVNSYLASRPVSSLTLLRRMISHQTEPGHQLVPPRSSVLCMTVAGSNYALPAMLADLTEIQCLDTVDSLRQQIYSVQG